MLDTGLNAPESVETLLLQQSQLVRGIRAVQMFPTGTLELALPKGMERCENSRGVFHFNPALLTAPLLLALSERGYENVFLNLGPFSKPEILRRVAMGERPMAVTEYTPQGVEVRCAAATDKTIPVQREYFLSTKERANIVVAGPIPSRATHAASRRFHLSVVK